MNRNLPCPDPRLARNYVPGDSTCAIADACGGGTDPATGKPRSLCRRHDYYVAIHRDAQHRAEFIAGTLRPTLSDITHIHVPRSCADHVSVSRNNYHNADGEHGQTDESSSPVPGSGQQLRDRFWREQAVFGDRLVVLPGHPHPGSERQALSQDVRVGHETNVLVGWVDLDRIPATLWGALVFDPRRSSTVAGYPPPVRLPLGGSVAQAALAGNEPLLSHFASGSVASGRHGRRYPGCGRSHGRRRPRKD